MPYNTAKVVTLTSFSYKVKPIPKAGPQANGGRRVVFDARKKVRNPWFNPTLRKLTGLDESVQAFVGQCKGGKSVVDQIIYYSAFVTDMWVGCQGGRHRSVAIVELAAAELRRREFQVTVVHRDLVGQAAAKSQEVEVASCPGKK